jgi:hypothetical protein
MSEHDQRHQHNKEAHDQAREEKKHHAGNGNGTGKAGPMFYPKWLIVIGIVLTLGAILVWTLA